ncbi:MAG TPA: cysteine hydrolase family protein [Chloroflexia bacterium]|nr:cysteine hydrolase family protein [Chloroflexia bacterium]
MSNDTALLVIDVQAGMFAENPPVHNGSELLAKIQDLLEKARASQTPVIYVRHNEKPGGSLETGTEGWQIHPAIAPRENEPIVDKRTPDSFWDTDLQQVLTSQNIKKLVVCGIQTEMCVDTTTRRACSMGYDIILVTDAHSTWDTDLLTAEQIIAHHNAVLINWFANGQRAAEVDFEKVTA